MFMNAMQNLLEEESNVSVTENGAYGYRTTGTALLDMNFAVASMRNATEESIVKSFMRAFAEDRILAMKWLFFARDCREGLGERRLFKAIISALAGSNPEIVYPVIKLIPEYGRWDDLWCLLDDEDINVYVLELIREQLSDDSRHMKLGEPISLLTKWLPSINASSKLTKNRAHFIARAMLLTPRNYRKMLSKFRAYLNVVEVKMSANEWDKIDYETVPSKANLIYRNAFMRHDQQRREEYLEKLNNGEATINASVLYPHEIVSKYRMSHVVGQDATIEALWEALPDKVDGCGNTMVVADGSGSMTVNIDGSSWTTALDVANAIAIYFAERSSGDFKNKFITFSENPQFVDMSGCRSLFDKLRKANEYTEVANTNIEKVFDLILHTAIANDMAQEDIPKNILIISDMEFDSCATCGYRSRPTTKLFDSISQRYKEHGYQLPRLVFWNVNSRTGTIPVKENALGVALVSGFSPNICEMVMSGNLDPYECLLETLNSERYEAIENALKSF